jgi:hypothetical protein
MKRLEIIAHPAYLVVSSDGDKMTAKDRYVIASIAGGWSVYSSGASRASRRFDRQSDAVRYARDLARRERTDLYVHRRDGTVSHRDSYADQQSPRRDKRG